MREAIIGHPSQSAAIRGISGGARGSLVRTAAPQSIVNIGHQEPSEARTAARLAQGRPWMLGDGAAPWRV